MKASTILTFFLLTTISAVSCGDRIISLDKNTSDTSTYYINWTSSIRQDYIPDSVFRLVNLKHLQVTGMDCDHIITDSNGNDITECWFVREIPKEISELKKLETLSLIMNDIKTIPSEIEKLKHLKSIDLSGNSNLASIDNLTNLDSLEFLYLYECSSLTTLPENIANLKTLKVIGLTGTDIRQSEIDRLKRLLPNCEIR